MADTDTPKATKPVDRIDFTKPYFLTLRQTETRNIITPIQGDDNDDCGLANVLKHVTEEAERLKVTIAVFGPQVGVVEPPKPAPSTFVGMDFGKKPE